MLGSTTPFEQQKIAHEASRSHKYGWMVIAKWQREGHASGVQLGPVRGTLLWIYYLSTSRQGPYRKHGSSMTHWLRRGYVHSDSQALAEGKRPSKTMQGSAWG